MCSFMINKKDLVEKLKRDAAVCTHYGDDMDNKCAIYFLEKAASLKLDVHRVPAGQTLEGMVNVDTGGHIGSYYDENTDTYVLDGGAKNVKSACSALSRIGFSVPSQIVKYADVVPSSKIVLSSRVPLGMVSYISANKIVRLAIDNKLDKRLSNYQLYLYGLKQAHNKKKKNLEKVIPKIKSSEVNDKVVLVSEFIPNGAFIAYALGYDVYASVQEHSSKNGVTFAVTVRPEISLPESIVELGKEYRACYGDGVFLHPDGNMLVAGSNKNPEFFKFNVSLF